MFIAYDLGTGGVKASLYDSTGETLAKTFVEYSTYYPESNMHEQCPQDWWKGIVEGTRELLEKTGQSGAEVNCLSISGQSLVAIPVDENGKILLDQVPIWSDTRAISQTERFFSLINENDWYMTTGNGFPAPCYSIFKLMWMKEHQPEIFSKIHKVLGSKDYINMLMTGKMYTDNSYASGTGAYDLVKAEFKEEFLNAAGIPVRFFPDLVPSHHIIGSLTSDAASALSLRTGTKVACGGVDNACMAMGAVSADEGKCYTSLGSSSWIAVNSATPILDATKKPYVFAHLEPGMFTSAFSIFSGGSSLRWVRDNICKDISVSEGYDKLTEQAQQAPVGSGGVIFNPSLAGGTSQDKSIHIRGAFLNLSLGTTREEMLRATLEGIALNLRISLGNIRERVTLSDEMLFTGGGSKSKFWMQIFADIFEMNILKTNIDQDAASLGAAAVAFKAVGLWENYGNISKMHKPESKSTPIPKNVNLYRDVFKLFVHANNTMSDLGEYIYQNRK